MSIILALTFWLFVGGSFAFAWRLGGREDRRMILWILAAVVATWACAPLPDMQRRILVRAIDFALLAIFVHHALESRRYWPVWFAGMLSAAWLLGMIALFVPTDAAMPLFAISASLSIPTLIVMLAGLALDHRNGLGHLGDRPAPQ